MTTKFAFSTLREATEDLGQSKHPAIRPTHKKIAPLLTRPFQKGMSQLSPAQRTKLITTYFKNVKLQGKANSKKNMKLLRDTLVKALIQDRGWIEFVAEEILEGCGAELAAVLSSGGEKKASMKTATDAGDGQIVFGIVTDDYNIEDDEVSDDPESQERYNEFLQSGGGDISQAAYLAEDKMIAQMSSLLSKALGRDVRINNEGHNDRELVCKFNVSSLAELRKAVDAIQRSYGSEGMIHSDTDSYTSAVGFMFFSYNGNRTPETRVEFDDIDEWIEDQGATTAATKTSAFMTPDYFEGTMYVYEGMDGHEHYPSDDFTKEQVADAVGVDPSEITEESGWWARLSASGYVDATDWQGPFTSEEEARQFITDEYDVDPDTGDELDTDGAFEDATVQASVKKRS